VTESEREHGGEREAGGLRQMADGVARVAQQVGEHRSLSSSRGRQPLQVVGQAVDARARVAAVGEDDVLGHALPVRHLIRGVGIGLGVGRAASERVAAEILELRRQLAHDP
jgi:hypothetical protein